VKVISPIFGSMSGKLGGAVGATSRGGTQYFRKLVKPGNPRSLYQTNVRLILTALSAAWRSTLTGVQRAGWESIAGATSSGIDAFVKGNTQAIIGALARTDTAPLSLALVTDPVLTCQYVTATHTLSFTGTATANVKWNIYGSPPQGASRLAQQFPVRYLSTASAGAAVSAVQPTTSPLYPAIAGQIVYVEVAQFGTPGAAFAGQVATPQRFRVVVA
jgi:hypothetical protein